MAVLNSILVPIDLSPLSLPTLKICKKISDKHDVRLHILCILEKEIIHSFEKLGKDITADFFKRSNDKIDELIQESGVQTTKHTREVIVGVPFMEILSKAARHSADLIVLGGQSWEGGRRLGQNAFKIIRTAPFHTLSLRPKSDDEDEILEDISFHKILVAFDFSEDAIKALEYAFYLQPIFDSEIHVLFVISEENDMGTGETNERLRQIISAEQHSVLATVSTLESPKPAKTIMKTARELDIDLITMGGHSRQRFWLKNLFLGKVAYDIVRKAPCSVFAVKQPD